MNVTIHERKFSFRSTYDISAPGVTYFAQKAFLAFLARLELRTEAGQVVAKLQSHFTFIRSNYDFVLADGRTYHFLCEKLWKGVYVCERPGESFHLYQHKGLRFSIFKGDSQIAAITKNRFVIGNGNEYDIRMNSDADVVVICCMVLALNTGTGDEAGNSSATYHFGSIGPEDRRFDEFWVPG
ncbi:MAG TPA: hypothetical protein VFC39_18785 [Acidobacteriaceae bacterium]|nr:hypothetical protein [Acidobacteriaceae bacterium]